VIVVPIYSSTASSFIAPPQSSVTPSSVAIITSVVVVTNAMPPPTSSLSTSSSSTTPIGRIPFGLSPTVSFASETPSASPSIFSSFSLPSAPSSFSVSYTSWASLLRPSDYEPSAHSNTFPVPASSFNSDSRSAGPSSSSYTYNPYRSADLTNIPSVSLPYPSDYRPSAHSNTIPDPSDTPSASLPYPSGLKSSAHSNTIPDQSATSPSYNPIAHKRLLTRPLEPVRRLLHRTTTQPTSRPLLLPPRRTDPQHQSQ
jgi:hypothetical protein